MIIILSTHLVSCSYEVTELDIGSNFTSTWSFSDGANYYFDTDFIEVLNGQASLRPLDLEHNTNDLISSGQFVGVTATGQGITLAPGVSLQSTHVNSILPTKENHLIGYWRFDGSLSDDSGNSHTGILNGSSAIASPQWIGTGAAQYSAVGDWVSVGDINELDALTELTVCSWVKTQMGGGAGIVSKSISSFNWLLYKTGGTDSVAFYVSTSGVSWSAEIGGSTVIHDDQWHFVCGVYDGTNISVYVNGTMEGTRSLGVPPVLPSNTDSVHLGTWLQSDVFEGSQDETSLWNTSLSAEEIQKVYEVQSAKFTEHSPSWTPEWEAVVGYWKMNRNWLDSSGKLNHGTPLADPGFSSQARVGHAAGLFDGTLDRVDVGVSPLFENSATQFSVSIWFYLDPSDVLFDGSALTLMDSSGGSVNAGGFSIILDDRGGGQPENSIYTSLRTTGGNLLFRGQDNLLDKEGWYHLGVSFDGNELIHTLNGHRITGLISGVYGDYVPKNNNFYIGSISGGSFTHSGQIDDLSIWSSALSAGDLVQIYHRQKQMNSGFYESEVIDLGSASANWLGMKLSTQLPFGKELVGDYNSDGTPDNETTLEYPGISLNLSDGLVGYWPLNERLTNSVLPGGEDFSDVSGNNNHGVEDAGVTLGTVGMFNTAPLFDGVDDKIEFNVNASLQTNSSSDNTFSIWIKVPPNQKDTAVSVNRVFVYGAGVEWTLISIFNQSHPNAGQLNFRRYDGSTTASLISVAKINDNEFHHIVAKKEGQQMYLYIDGEFDSQLTDNTSMSLQYNALRLAGDAGPSSRLFGHLDEFAIWSRGLTESEIQQVYRRGANRIKVQIKSCIDVACECESYNSAPQGNATDCNGNGISNALDFSDNYKSKWLGPGGDGTTFYSELLNRDSGNIIFSCGQNLTDNNSSLCVDDEITLAGPVKPFAMEILTQNYTQFIEPIANRYAQYRVYLESDRESVCLGLPCLPEFSSLSLNPLETLLYANEYMEIKPKKPITFKKLVGINISAESCATFRIGRGGVNYYHDGNSWVVVAESAHRNTKAELKSHFLQFASQYGAGELEVVGYLQSDINRTQNCTIDDLDVFYE